MIAGDTIAALSSGRPPAAIAVIRLSGPDAMAAAEAIVGPLPKPRTAALRDFKDPANGEVIDSGILLVFPGPRSVTGEDIVEFQCHGGKAVVDRLLGVLIAGANVRLADPGEFTRRALASGRIDLTEAEGLADLLAAETELQRQSAQARAGGALRDRLQQWRERLLMLSAAAEVAIDYADEDDGASATPLVDCAALAGEVRTLLESPRVEVLRDGVRVVFAGPPNAGKSSLINALAGSARAIVTPIAGTTRDVIEVPLAIDGVPVVLVDTAGLRPATDEIERIGVELATEELRTADIVAWLGNSGAVPPGRVLLVRAKCDLAEMAGADGLAVSAVTGEGLDDLRAGIRTLSLECLPAPRQLALTTREAILATELADALESAAGASDPIIAAEELRLARLALDRISGRVGVEDVLEQLFGRFCLGK